VDGAGRPVTNVTLNWAVAGGGSLDNAVTMPTGGEDPTLNGWSIGPTEGVQSITVTLPGRPGVQGVLHVRAVKLRVVPITPADTSGGVSLGYGEQTQLTAQLLTSDGKPFPWFIRFTGGTTPGNPCYRNGNFGSFGPSSSATPINILTVPTDAQGRATVTYTAPTAQFESFCAAQVEAEPGDSPGGITGVPGGLSWTFGLIQPPASQVVIVSGNGQAASPGATLAQPLVVGVTDKFGNGVAGVTVTWTTSSGSLSASTTTTDRNGLTRVTWTVGTAPGTQTATASIAGGTHVDFTVTVS
jgi:Flp pilus assembly protein TadG